LVYLRAVNRFLAFILAFIVAIASLTPCCDEGEQGEETAIAGKQQDHEEEDGCSCSPFYACATCPGFISTAQPIIIPAPAEYQPSWFIKDLPYFPSTYTSTPWQPPRTS
jgi:hypothetical protein